MANEKKERICLGVIVGVHGIKGEVKVKSWTSDDDSIDSYGPLQTKDCSRSFALRVLGRSKELLRCKIKGIDDRNGAEALIGTELYVNRDVLPDLEEEIYYQTDLIGLDVLEQSTNRKVGTISGVFNFGAGDILEIRLDISGKQEMIPFTRQYVPELHIKEGFVTVSSSGMNFAADDEETSNES